MNHSRRRLLHLAAACSLAIAAPTSARADLALQFLPETITACSGQWVNPQNLLAGGGQPTSGYTWTVQSGFSLPTGIALNSLTGVIQASNPGLLPAPGMFDIPVTITDQIQTANTAPGTFTLDTTQCNGRPIFQVLAGVIPLQAQANVPYGVTLSVVGGVPPYTWTLAPGSSLPGGLVLDQSTGVVRGTPTSTGQFQFFINVRDSTGAAATVQNPYTLNVGTGGQCVFEVSPTTNVAISGNQGGPFSPGSFGYQVSTLSGTAPYTISGLPNWLTVPSTSGTATPTPATITFTVNSNANNLAPGTYGATVIFGTSPSACSAQRTVSLAVTSASPGALLVSPATNIVSSGQQGGPFSPNVFNYQLSASAGSVGYAISGVPSWLTASSSSDTVGTSPTTVSFTINATANALAPATYNASILFANTTNGQGTQSRSATLNVTATYTISVSASPPTGGTVTGGGTFPAGSTRTVTALANSGYNFVNWTESGNIVSTAASYPFILNSNRTLVANFAAQSYSISVSAMPPAGGMVSGGGTFPAGSTQTITAVANGSYGFVNWTESGNIVSTAASYTFILNSNRTLVANFSQQGFSINVSAMPPAGGMVSGGGTFPAGSTQTVTAVANGGYGFVNWTESGNIVNTAANYTFILNSNRTLVANFTTQSYSVSVSASPPGGGTVTGGGTFPAGSTQTVTAAANSGYRFFNWTESGNVVSTAASYSFTLNSNRALVANFTTHPTLCAAAISTWDANAVSGTLANDLVDSHPGSLNGGVAVVPGAGVGWSEGNAFQFDGSTGYIDMGLGVGQFGTGPFSLEAWFLWTGAGSSVDDIIRNSDYPVSGPAAGYWIRINQSAQTLEFFVGNPVTSNPAGLVTTAVAPNAWHHVVATRDPSGAMTLYLDGQPVGTSSVPPAFNVNTSDARFALGAWNDRFGVVEFFPGLMDQISIYNRALTAAEVQTLFSFHGRGFCTAGLANAHDFNADGKSDVAWRDTSGNVAFWLMNGAAVTSTGGIGGVPATWSIVGQRDFDGDGKADLLWRDTGGNTAIWLMNGTQIASATSIGNIPPTWSVIATGDFNGDGKGDILWRDGSGNVAMWLMNGPMAASSVGLGNVPSTWSVVGTGDFNGDGMADLLWRDTSGNTAIWFMNGMAVGSSAGVGNIPTAWSVVGTGDFNADGKSDIVWHDNLGNTSIWLMNGATVLSAGGLGNVVDCPDRRLQRRRQERLALARYERKYFDVVHERCRRVVDRGSRQYSDCVDRAISQR
jgi:hypothetical protein